MACDASIGSRHLGLCKVGEDDGGVFVGVAYGSEIYIADELVDELALVQRDNTGTSCAVAVVVAGSGS